ncbi:hypothetical protein [Paenibacillus tarimensis]|uniref:hypothetical protein n=1 Tax=Paenibacillus tarimensis TaxID=416012 RepID=UPI001F459C0E|nr:hypothetical protein [Paenibacillus tarimensis]MCF2945588.1 hypothetical protein [Paenibacillus tarimensis]
MSLLDVEFIFNQHYNFNELKNNSIKLLENLINNSCSNYLSEEEGKLEDGLRFKDYIIRYKCIELFINNHDRVIPFFRVCLELLHPKTEIQKFYYDIEYTINGEFSDEYFGAYN